MWIFTKFGFYSVTLGDPEYCPDKGSDCFQIRARARVDLELLEAWAEVDQRAPKYVYSALSSIVHTPAADYPFRVVISEKGWKWLASHLASTVDYRNFKSTIKDNERHDIYMRVWSVLKGLSTLGQRVGYQRALDFLDRDVFSEPDPRYAYLDPEYYGSDGPEAEDDLDQLTDERSPFYDPARAKEIRAAKADAITQAWSGDASSDEIPF
jgi:hypothetical protein